MDDDTYQAYVSSWGTDADLSEYVPDFATAAEGWAHLIAIAERHGLSHAPDDEDDPEGPQSITPLVEKMQDYQNYYGPDKGRGGTVYDPQGRAWTVE